MVIWITQNEIDFLKGLGTYKDPSLKKMSKRILTSEERIRLLVQYRETMKNRVKWGWIDPQVVLGVLNQMLHELRTGVAAA